MKKILIVAFLFISVNAFAQIKIGLQGGVIASRLAIKDTNTFVMAVLGEKKMRAGFKAGAFAEFALSEKLFFNPAINFVYKGGNFKSKFFENNITHNFTMSYLEAPLNLVVKASNAGGFYGGAGPSIGMGLGGNVKKENKKDNGTADPTSNQGIKFDGKAELDFDNYHFKTFEIGLSAFVGYELHNGIRFQLEYRPEFSNIATNPENTSYKNSYFGLMIGCAL